MTVPKLGGLPQTILGATTFLHLGPKTQSILDRSQWNFAKWREICQTLKVRSNIWIPPGKKMWSEAKIQNWRKIWRIRVNNVEASGNNLIKLHVMCRKTRMIIGTNFSAACTLKICGWTNRRDFGQLQTMIANICETDQETENRKTTWLTAMPICVRRNKFGPVTTKFSWLILTHPKSTFLGWPYFGPYGMMPPQIFTRATERPRLASAHVIDNWPKIRCILANHWGQCE